MEKLAIAIIIVSLVVFGWYGYTHSFSYKWNRAIDRCVDEENLGRKTCADREVKQWIDACKELQPQKTDEQCMHMLDDEYHGRNN